MCNRCKWSSHTGRCLPRCLFTSELNARYVFRAGCSGVMAVVSAGTDPISASVMVGPLSLSEFKHGPCPWGRRSCVASSLPLHSSPQQCPRSPRNNFTRSSGETVDVDSCGGRSRVERQRSMRVIAIVFILRPGFLWLFHRAEPFRRSNAARSNPVPPRSGPLQASSWPTKEPRIFRIQVVRVWRVSPGRGRRQG